ncbi:MAG: spore maturation protein [Verrucomicrobia bacterium]|nr:spore maturation protein [Verrucomicrobiota bacterium]
MFAFSVVAIPFIWLFFIVYAWVRGVKVYEEFVEGAKEGFGVAVRIMPFLVTMLVALAIFRDSGALLVMQNLMRPFLNLVSFPVELVPMALMRPLSGSGSQGVLVEILTNEGLSDTLKYTAATMFGSTETTFYVLAVYFGSVGIRRARHALAAGLCADAAGIIAAVVICKLVFG